MVTAELAATMPAVALVIAVVLGAVDLAIGQVRCVDAARAAARAAAREDRAANVARLARMADPGLTQLTVHREGGTVRVTVVGAEASIAGFLRLPWRPRASAVAALESGPDP